MGVPHFLNNFGALIPIAKIKISAPLSVHAKGSLDRCGSLGELGAAMWFVDEGQYFISVGYTFYQLIVGVALHLPYRLPQAAMGTLVRVLNMRPRHGPPSGATPWEMGAAGITGRGFVRQIGSQALRA